MVFQKEQSMGVKDHFNPKSWRFQLFTCLPAKAAWGFTKRAWDVRADAGHGNLWNGNAKNDFMVLVYQPSKHFTVQELQYCIGPDQKLQSSTFTLHQTSNKLQQIDSCLLIDGWMRLPFLLPPVTTTGLDKRQQTPLQSQRSCASPLRWCPTTETGEEMSSGKYWKTVVSANRFLTTWPWSSAKQVVHWNLFWTNGDLPVIRTRCKTQVGCQLR